VALGAKLTARLLPRVEHEDTFQIRADIDIAGSTIDEFLQEFGEALAEFPCDRISGNFYGVVGSGHPNLNLRDGGGLGQVAVLWTPEWGA